VVTSLLVVGELIYGVEKSTNDGALLDGTLSGLTVENWKV
jgi:predicted nucleic acid-binding protein